MRTVVWALVTALAFGLLAVAGDASAAWPSERGASVSCWRTNALSGVLQEGLVHLPDDSFYPCYSIGCACESNLLACCREMCCPWTCWFIPWMCDCFYRTTCYWVPNCDTSPVLPLKVGPVGGEL